MRVLGLIPARGGSKGVARKNIKSLCGKPLLHYTAEAARRAERLTTVVVSTDDHEVAETARACGLDVPFMRPAELARDETPMIPVVQHALRTLEAEGKRHDAVCLLQPTSPLRRAEDIDACIGLLESEEVDTVISVLPVPDKFNPHWVYLETEEPLLRLVTGAREPIPRRQELPRSFYRDGSVYVVRRDVILDKGTLFGERVCGYKSPPGRHVNIDSMEDWERAKKIMGCGS